MKLIIARLELKVEDSEVEPALGLIRATREAGAVADVTVLDLEAATPRELAYSWMNGQNELCLT